MNSDDFFAFDIVIHNGVDVRPLALCERLTILNTFDLARPATGCGGEFLEAVLARGGEGAIAKRVDAPFGQDWWRCKGLSSYDVIVSDTSAHQRSVGISEWRDGHLHDAGRVSVFNLSILASLCCGDVIEIAAQCRTANGKFRSPRFVRSRPDKPRFGFYC